MNCLAERCQGSAGLCTAATSRLRLMEKFKLHAAASNMSCPRPVRHQAGEAKILSTRTQEHNLLPLSAASAPCLAGDELIPAPLQQLHVWQGIIICGGVYKIRGTFLGGLQQGSLPVEYFGGLPFMQTAMFLCESVRCSHGSDAQEAGCSETAFQLGKCGKRTSGLSRSR